MASQTRGLAYAAEFNRGRPQFTRSYFRDLDELTTPGLALEASLPGIDRKVPDHATAVVDYRRKEPGPFQRNMRRNRIGLALGKARLFDAGLAPGLPSGMAALLRTTPDAILPDLRRSPFGGRTRRCEYPTRDSAPSGSGGA